MRTDLAGEPGRIDSERAQPSKPRRASLRRLFSFQLRRLNLLYSRASASIYGRDFGMTLTEWRLFAELHDTCEERVPFGCVTQQTGFDVGLASRTVDALVGKGLVMRLVDPRDARLREVSLTDQGRAVGSRMLAVVKARNKRLLSRLSPQDRAALQRIMQVLIDEAAAMLAQEMGQQGAPVAGRDRQRSSTERRPGEGPKTA